MAGLPDCFGVMVNPTCGGVSPPVREGRPWAADNGCFGGRYDHERYVRYLTAHQPHRETCLFVTVPDVVADAKATRDLWGQYSGPLAQIGLPLAWVAQDGATPDDIPTCACVFIGGTTEFKVSEQAASIVDAARAKGLWVHIGRVNSRRRIRWARSVGACSVDGTCERFAGREETIRRFCATLTEEWLW